MPHEKVYTSDQDDGYLKVEWYLKDVYISVHSEPPEFTRQFINKSCGHTPEELEEINAVIYEAHDKARQYGYWMRDLIERALEVVYENTSDMTLMDKYQLAFEILQYTHHLDDTPAAQLVRPKPKVIILNREGANKALKSIKRAALAVFGKNEW